MKWLWTWSGKSFGYREGDDLWTSNGHHVGRFQGDTIYALTGQYLGELMHDNRLVTHRGKRSHRGLRHGHYGKRAGMASYANSVGFVMLAGYEDFPEPGTLEPSRPSSRLVEPRWSADQ